MAHRSLLRPEQLDSNGSYSFAQLVLDGYSGGLDPDGYLMALVLTDGYDGGTETIRMDAHNGAINQLGTGQVQFSGNVDAKSGLDVSGANLTVALDAQITGSLYVSTDAVIEGDLTVNGTTTTINSETLVVTDPVVVINSSRLETLGDWTGLSAGDSDGYNQIGWVFAEGAVDGYWALSSSYSGGTDAAPDRAIAYIGAGETDGDLSSTEVGNSGADKIGVSEITGLVGDDVQECLESLQSGLENIPGTDSLTFIINQDAEAATDENPCLILKGGDGTSLMDGYLCLITDSVAGTKFQFQTLDDGTRVTTSVSIGSKDMTESADAELLFNSANGTDSYGASITLDGAGSDPGKLLYVADGHEFTGDVSFVNDITVIGASTFDGNVVIGSDSSDTVDVKATIVSDLMPTDCTYQLGDETHKWLDGYFCLFTPTNYTPVGSVYSLEGHLKGLDQALVTGSHPRGVYVVTSAEKSANEVSSSRTPDQGDTVAVGALTDDEFRDDILVYYNGQLLYNDPSPAVNGGAVQNDVARKTGTLGTLVFGFAIKTGTVLQIITTKAGA